MGAAWNQVPMPGPLCQGLGTALFYWLETNHIYKHHHHKYYCYHQKSWYHRCKDSSHDGTPNRRGPCICHIRRPKQWTTRSVCFDHLLRPGGRNNGRSTAEGSATHRETPPPTNEMNEKITIIILKKNAESMGEWGAARPTFGPVFVWGRTKPFLSMTHVVRGWIKQFFPISLRSLRLGVCVM